MIPSNCAFCEIDGKGVPYCSIHDDGDCDNCEDYAEDDSMPEPDIEFVRRNLRTLWVGKSTFGKFGTDRLPVVMIETPTSTYLVLACQFVEYLHKNAIKCFDEKGNEIVPPGRKPLPEDVKFGG